MPRPNTLRAVMLVKAGCTTAEAAAAVGAAESTVVKACRAAGVALPARAEPVEVMRPVSIKMTAAQRERFAAMHDGAARVRKWIDAAPINRPSSR